MNIELQHELDTFLEAYAEAANSRNFDNVAPFIAEDASFWFSEGSFTGLSAIRKAFEATYQSIQNEVYTISDVHWVATTDETSACTYHFKSDGIVDGKRQVYEGRGTSILRRLDGSWRIIHEHLSK